MTNKDIEKAAESSTEKYVENGDLRGFRGSYRLGFIAGADWRINSVWHDVSEVPKGNNELLTLNRKGVAFVIKSYCWKDEVKIFDIVKWAYIKDLTPNKEVKQ